MYEDTVLPVRTKLQIPSRSRVRIYFVQEHTRKSLFFIKWIELVICLLCLCFAIMTINVTTMESLKKAIIIASNTFSILVVLAEITYHYFERTLPMMLQVLSVGVNAIISGTVAVLVCYSDNHHELMKTLLFLNGATSVVFLIDFICKLIIATYLHQITRVKSVVDAAVSVFLRPNTPAPGRPKPNRSILTATPITYGGTFPVGKNQPPFLPEDRVPPCEGCHTPDKGTRHKTVQTPHYGDCKAIGGSSFDFGLSSVEKIMSRSKCVQIPYAGQEDKGTSTIPPFYIEEERRKKSPWTCSTPTTCRKIESRKQASMSTPITYSGTFAVNKELVPITPAGVTGMSPKSSPRGRKPISRSEGNSPSRSDNVLLDVHRLDHISEEKISLQVSSENCSVCKSNLSFYDPSVLPGSVLEEDEYSSKKNMQYHPI